MEEFKRLGDGKADRRLGRLDGSAVEKLLRRGVCISVLDALRFGSCRPGVDGGLTLVVLVKAKSASDDPSPAVFDIPPAVGNAFIGPGLTADPPTPDCRLRIAVSILRLSELGTAAAAAGSGSVNVAV